MITKKIETHPSRMYPKQSPGTHAIEVICPACQSHHISFLSLSPELAFKRRSTCNECGTVWTTRTGPIPAHYEQRFRK